MAARDLVKEAQEKLRKGLPGSKEALAERMQDAGVVVKPPKPETKVEPQTGFPGIGLNQWGLPIRAMDRRAKDRYTGRGQNLARDRFTPERYPHLQCKAMRRSKEGRCRNVAYPGWHLCAYHGAQGVRNPDGTVTRGPVRKGRKPDLNRAVKKARKHARKNAPPASSEVWDVFRRDYAHKVPDSDHERFVILLDVKMKNGMSMAEWKGVLRDYCTGG